MRLTRLMLVGLAFMVSLSVCSREAIAVIPAPEVKVRGTVIKAQTTTRVEPDETIEIRWNHNTTQGNPFDIYILPVAKPYDPNRPELAAVDSVAPASHGYYATSLSKLLSGSNSSTALGSTYRLVLVVRVWNHTKGSTIQPGGSYSYDLLASDRTGLHVSLELPIGYVVHEYRNAKGAQKGDFEVLSGAGFGFRKTFRKRDAFFSGFGMHLGAVGISHLPDRLTISATFEFERFLDVSLGWASRGNSSPDTDTFYLGLGGKITLIEDLYGSIKGKK